MCTWVIPFHSDWKYRLDYAISLWQYCPPSHAWYLCDNIHVSSRWCLDVHIANSFSVGHMISAALMCLDYIYIGIAHALQESMLITSFLIKISFIIIELSLIIAFRVTEHTHYNENNMAATLEWSMYLYFSWPFNVVLIYSILVIAFLFTGYILSLIVDLLPSDQKKVHNPNGYQQLEMSGTLLSSAWLNIL